MTGDQGQMMMSLCRAGHCGSCRTHNCEADHGFLPRAAGHFQHSLPDFGCFLPGNGEQLFSSSGHHCSQKNYYTCGPHHGFIPPLREVPIQVVEIVMVHGIGINSIIWHRNKFDCLALRVQGLPQSVRQQDPGRGYGFGVTVLGLRF